MIRRHKRTLAPKGVSHTLGLTDNGYTSGGILNSPPQQILPSEVDKILKVAYDKK